MSALTNDPKVRFRHIQASIPGFCKKKEKERLGSFSNKKKNQNTKKKNLPIHTFPEYRTLESQSLFLKKKKGFKNQIIKQRNKEEKRTLPFSFRPFSAIRP